MELLLLLGLLLGIGAAASGGNSDEEESDDDTSLDLYRPSNGIQHFTGSSSGYDPYSGDWWRNRIDMTIEDD